jgi:hypothetical protein
MIVTAICSAKRSGAECMAVLSQVAHQLADME